MRKIRIGNDIRLKLKIEPNEALGFKKIDEFDLSSIKQLKCYLINTSFRKMHLEKHKPHFHRVGFPEFYHPTAHNINNSGFPSYHMEPANICNYDRFIPDFHDYHWFPGYRGFGVHPEHFHDHCHHYHEHGPHPHHLHHCDHCLQNPHSWYEHNECRHENNYCWGCPVHDHHYDFDVMEHHYDPDHCHDHHHDKFAHLFHDPYYVADSQVLHETNTLTCLFPALDQKLCGTYKLVVVMTVFESGWGRHNLRTYTIDKGDMFELVDDESGDSGNIVITPDDTGERENLISYLFTEHDNYRLATDSVMKLGEHDIDGLEYILYAILKDGTEVIYNPYDWHYNELIFESGDEEALTVGKDGTLYAHDIEEVERRVPVTVRDIDNNVQYTFYVTIKKLDTILIGFDPAEDITTITSDNTNLKEYDAKAKTFTVLNVVDGYYLWIFSQRRIHYIKSVEEDDELVAELSSGFRVPMTSTVIHDGYYCYRSAAPILGGSMKFKIKFA